MYTLSRFITDSTLQHLRFAPGAEMLNDLLAREGVD